MFQASQGPFVHTRCGAPTTSSHFVFLRARRRADYFQPFCDSASQKTCQHQSSGVIVTECVGAKPRAINTIADCVKNLQPDYPDAGS